MPGLHGVDGLIGQPGCTVERGLDILRLQVGIRLQDVLLTHAIGDQVQYSGDRDPQAADARSPTLHRGVKRNTLQTQHQSHLLRTSSSLRTQS